MADTILEKIEALVNGGHAKAYVPKHYTLRLKKVSAPYSYDNEYGETHYDLPTGGAIIKGTSTPFKIGNLTIVPDVDMLCMIPPLVRGGFHFILVM